MANSSRMVGVSILIITFLIGGAFWFTRRDSGRPEETSHPPQEVLPQDIAGTALKEQSGIMKMSKLSIPAVTSSTVIARDQLPQDLQELVHYYGKEVLIRATIYENKQKGLTITQSVPESAPKLYQNFSGILRSQNGWTRVFGGHAIYFGVIEAASAKYSLRVSITQIAGSPEEKSQVVIEIIQL